MFGSSLGIDFRQMACILRPPEFRLTLLLPCRRLRSSMPPRETQPTVFEFEHRAGSTELTSISAVQL